MRKLRRAWTNWVAGIAALAVISETTTAALNAGDLLGWATGDIPAGWLARSTAGLVVVCLFLGLWIYHLHKANAAADGSHADIDTICRNAQKLVYGMYPDGKTAHHLLDTVDYEVWLNDRGDADITDKRTIRSPDRPLHFFTGYVDADDESPAIRYLSDLNLTVRSDECDVAWLPFTNKHRKKELCVFFLPYLDKERACPVTIKLRWPDLLARVRECGETDFYWQFDTANAGHASNLSLTLSLPPEMADLQLTPIRTPPGARFEVDQDRNSRWRARFVGEAVHLHGQRLSMRVKRTDSGATSAATTGS